MAGPPSGIISLERALVLRSRACGPMLVWVVGWSGSCGLSCMRFLWWRGYRRSTHADTPSPSAFTTQFARALQAAMPSAKVRIVRDLQLDVERSDGTAATVSLANNYKDYTPDPKWFDAVIRAYAAALAKPLPEKVAANVDIARIVPVIKDRAWLAELQGRFKKHDASQQPLFDDFNGELVVVYAEDTDKRTRYLSSSEIVRRRARKIALACGRQPDASDAADRNAPARCRRIHDHVTCGLWCESCIGR